MKKVIRYEVFDNKHRWMGGYSTDLANAPLNHPTSAKDMAIMNADQSLGSVYEVYSDGQTIEVYSVTGSLNNN